MEYLDSVLIIGGGGREHAILKAMLRSNRPLCMYAFPGNAGMENDGCIIVEEQIRTWKDLAVWALDNEINLTIVGPEKPLVDGVVDIFTKAGLTICGPTKKAAQLEGSKLFAKNLMKRYNIPTASFEAFHDKASTLEYVQKSGIPVIIKVNGIAAGKGVFVCNTMEEVHKALHQIFDAQSFGDATDAVIVEEKMVGEEASLFVLTDGENYKILPVAQDHKTVSDGDKGPNTGGMGAYAPAPVIDPPLLARIEKEIVRPTLHAMEAEGATYRGILYIGLMITPTGPKVIEYNCRFGDPEAEAILPLVECDWFEAFKACAQGTLENFDIQVHSGFCVSVVLASQGYPGKFEKGKLISGIESAERNKTNVDVYHSSTLRNENGEFVTNGGRVLVVTVWDETLEDAIVTAYENVAIIDFDGKQYRKDIGSKGLSRVRQRINKQTER